MIYSIIHPNMIDHHFIVVRDKPMRIDAYGIPDGVCLSFDRVELGVEVNTIGNDDTCCLSKSDERLVVVSQDEYNIGGCAPTMYAGRNSILLMPNGIYDIRINGTDWEDTLRVTAQAVDMALTDKLLGIDPCGCPKPKEPEYSPSEVVKSLCGCGTFYGYSDFEPRPATADKMLEDCDGNKVWGASVGGAGMTKFALGCGGEDIYFWNKSNTAAGGC